MADMTAARSRIAAAGAWTSGPSTLLDVLDLSRAEVQNCRVLRWLLDPLARHGLGERFTRALCDYLDVVAIRPELTRSTVEISRALSRADLVLEGLEGGRVLVVEAKIDAPEGERQAERLEEDWPEAERFVFLTVSGDRVPSTATERDKWRPLSWTWLASTIEGLLVDPPHAADARAFDARRAATDWAAGVRRNLQ
jgi:hypothetical protein